MMNKINNEDRETIEKRRKRIKMRACAWVKEDVIYGLVEYCRGNYITIEG
jgi:hypothetical protein